MQALFSHTRPHTPGGSPKPDFLKAVSLEQDRCVWCAVDKALNHIASLPAATKLDARPALGNFASAARQRAGSMRCRKTFGPPNRANSLPPCFSPEQDPGQLPLQL